MEVTRILARYVVNSRAADIPASVKHEAVRSIVNWLGCAVGGAKHEAVECALAALTPFAGPKQASVLGREDKTDILNAALMNGITSHVFDFDDTHLPTIIHPSGPVASALFALAEYRPVTGAELLHAFILGVEVECRIGNAVYPNHYDVGWHITGTAGVFGAAAAAGKLLGLNEQQMMWALGIAGTQSSGFREMFGTHCKSFHPGRAAQNGLASALLARKELHQLQSGARGQARFRQRHVDQAGLHEDHRRAGQDLRGDAEFLQALCLRHCHSPFHRRLRAIETRTRADRRRNRKGRADRRAAGARTDRQAHPQVGLEGKFSVFHSCAVALLHGAAGEKEYSDAMVRDPKVIALRDRVQAAIDPKLRDDEVHVRVTLKDGRVLENMSNTPSAAKRCR